MLGRPVEKEILVPQMGYECPECGTNLMVEEATQSPTYRLKLFRCRCGYHYWEKYLHVEDNDS